MDIIPHLFRTEHSRITAVLCKTFGLDELEAAEDIASETFVAALQSWPYSGIPADPVAWLHRVAKNKTFNYLRRTKNFRQHVSLEWKKQQEKYINVPDLSASNIKDSQLRMLFAVCHPRLSKESQIALSLRILCGFGIDEVASAFLITRETAVKRLFRAREKLRREAIKLEFPGEIELHGRLPNVLTTLYLLFNEGYYSETNEQVIRQELCSEAMQLAQLLLQDDRCNRPEVNALMALMCFQSSRLPARKNLEGETVLYHDQDKSLWNLELVSLGAEYLHTASRGETFSRYHLEASIAFWYTVKDEDPSKWEKILELYNYLLILEYSPIAALNRTYALALVKGKEYALQEALKLALRGNTYYHSLLGWLYADIDAERARQELLSAVQLAKTSEEKRLLRSRIHLLG